MTSDDEVWLRQWNQALREPDAPGCAAHAVSRYIYGLCEQLGDELVDGCPGSVYHYTSVEKAASILRSRCFRFSNPRYPSANDWPAELKMGYELMAGSFAGFQPDPHVRYPRVASALVDLLRQWMDPVTSPFRPDVQLDFFNASYSAHADSAVMWQRYGVGGRGFVFGFDAAAIGATHPYRRALARVRYSAEQHAALQDQAASLLGRAANSIASLGGPVEVQKARNLTTLPIMSVLFGLAAVIKDWRWNDEAEWRTTLLARPRSDFVKYDERGQAEYLTQPLVGLKEVRAGPRVSDRERNEMKSMLCQAGYGSIALLDSDVDAPFAATPTP